MSLIDQQNVLRDIEKDLKQNSPAFKKVQNTAQTAVVFKEEEFVKHCVMQLYFYVEPPTGSGQFFGGKQVGEGRQELTQSQLGQVLGSDVTDVKGTFFSNTETTDVSNKKLLSSATLKGSPQLASYEKAMKAIFKTKMLSVVKKAAMPGNMLSKDIFVTDAGNGVFIFYTTENNKNIYNALSTKVFAPTNAAIKQYIQFKLNPDTVLKSTSGPNAGNPFLTKEGELQPNAMITPTVLFNPQKAIDIGHFYSDGSQLQGLEQAIKKATKDLSQKDKAEVSKLIAETKQKNAAARIDFGISTEFVFNHEVELKNGVKFNAEGFVKLSPESSGLNSGWFVVVENKMKDDLEASVKRILTADKLLNTKGSKTLRQNILGVLVDYQVKVVDDKTRGKKATSKASRHKKPAESSVNFAHKNAKMDSGRVNIPSRKKGSRKTPDSVNEVAMSLTSMTAIINEHLPMYLQANMGKGAANQVLNWRSGRFGQSAQLKALIEVKGSRGLMIQGLVSYMRHPYDVFRPGHKMYKPGRDPKVLIDKSIRQIMRDKALSALSFKSTLG